jgi:predicted DNA-binding transcriptional regulator YafY
MIVTWPVPARARCGCCHCCLLRRYWPGPELAGRRQVSPRTLRRDIGRLRELGYPIQAQRGADGGYQLAAGTALPPLLVEDEEAVALVIGLQAAAQSAVEGIAESSVRALAKVVQVMPTRLRRRVEALGAMTVPASWGSAAQASVGPGHPHHRRTPGRSGCPACRSRHLSP